MIKRFKLEIAILVVMLVALLAEDYIFRSVDERCVDRHFESGNVVTICRE